MKKLRNLLFVFAVMSVMLLPVKANALEIDFSKVPKCTTPDKEGYCTSETVGSFKLTTASETFDSVTFIISLKDKSSANGIKDFTAVAATGFKADVQSGGTGVWTVMVTKDTATLNTTDYTKAVTISFKHLATVNCAMNVSTKDVTVEIEQEITETKTGASLPMVVLGCGAVAALAVYGVTSKKTKIRKI